MPEAQPAPLTREQRALKAAVCEETADLYTAAGREALGRVLAQVLGPMGVTPIELLHSDVLQTRIADAGQTLMQAVQKAAVAQVKGTQVPVSQRVRRLFDLSDAIRAETRDRLASLKPQPVTPEQIDDLLRYAADEDEDQRRFRILATVTATLAEKKSWVEKFGTVFELARDVAGMDAFQVFDGLVAEIIRFPKATQDLLGRAKTGEEELTRLVGLYDGTLGPTDAPPSPPAARNLYALLFADPMPETRGVILDQIVHLLAGKDPLTNGPVARELAAVIAADTALRRDGDHLGGEEVARALEARCARQLSDETIELVMADVANQGDRILRALKLHEEVIGEKARVYLETYVTAMVREADAEKKILEGLREPIDKVIRLGRLHAAIKTSTIARNVAERLADRFEQAQAAVIESEKVPESLARRAKVPVKRAVMLVAMIADGVFIPGANAAAARRWAQDMVARKGFLDAYLEGVDDAADRKRRLVELQTKLAGAGLA